MMLRKPGNGEGRQGGGAETGGKVCVCGKMMRWRFGRFFWLFMRWFELAKGLGIHALFGSVLWVWWNLMAVFFFFFLLLLRFGKNILDR